MTMTMVVVVVVDARMLGVVWMCEAGGREDQVLGVVGGLISAVGTLTLSLNQRRRGREPSDAGASWVLASRSRCPLEYARTSAQDVRRHAT